MKTDCDSRFAEIFYIEDDEVYFEGDEFWSYGGYEHHKGYFPLSYLTMSDEELTRLVEERNKEYQKKQEEEKKRREDKAHENKVKLFKKLKSELGL